MGPRLVQVGVLFDKLCRIVTNCGRFASLQSDHRVIVFRSLPGLDHPERFRAQAPDVSRNFEQKDAEFPCVSSFSDLYESQPDKLASFFLQT